MFKDNKCKTFSAEADRYARGAAATTFYIKQLADAIRKYNTVRAVISTILHNANSRLQDCRSRVETHRKR